MTAETPLPWAANPKAQDVLARLQMRPQTTVDLQRELPLVHVARQVWELRHWYGHRITTRRLRSGVALYTLEPGAPVGAGLLQNGSAAALPAPSRAPDFGDMAAVYTVVRRKRHTLARGRL